MLIDFSKTPPGECYDKDGNILPIDRNSPSAQLDCRKSTYDDRVGVFCECTECHEHKFYTQFKQVKDGGLYCICNKCLEKLLDDRDPDNVRNFISSLGYEYYPNIFAKYDNREYGKTLTSHVTEYLKHISGTAEDMLLKENKMLQGQVQSIGHKTKRAKIEMKKVQETEKLMDDIAYDDAMEERRIADEMTADDRQRMRMKWGSSYKPSEWVKMEGIYDQYASEYEMSVDRENALRNLCKVALKMDQALDDNDVKAYKDLSSTYDMLRKSAKFTDSQRKEQKAREIDSIGQLVQFVEYEGGIIPEYDIDPIEEPQDKVDFLIKDMRNYVDNLVRNELGLGNLIESFIKKEEENKTESVDEIMAKGFESDDDKAISDDDEMTFQDFLLGQLEDEARALSEGDFNVVEQSD